MARRPGVEPGIQKRSEAMFFFFSYLSRETVDVLSSLEKDHQAVVPVQNSAIGARFQRPQVSRLQRDNNGFGREASK